MQEGRSKCPAKGKQELEDNGAHPTVPLCISEGSVRHHHQKDSDRGAGWDSPKPQHQEPGEACKRPEPHTETYR